MKPKSQILAVGGILAALVLTLVFMFYMSLRGGRGVAKNVADLATVYRDAGPAFAAFYTNSFLQKMPFNKPISWRRTSARFISVSLTGSVDVATFKRVMANEQFQSFSPPGAWWGGREARFTIHHRIGDWAVRTHGRLDTNSGALGVQSYTLESKINDWDWGRITNQSLVGFDFDKQD